MKWNKDLGVTAAPPLNKLKSGAFTLELKQELPQNDRGNVIGNVEAMFRQCKTAINSEIGDKMAINTKNGDKSGDKSAINSGIGDKLEVR